MGKDPSEIKREIEETRLRMGDTVEALGYKADIPARVKDNVDERVETVKGSVADVVGTVRESVTGATGKVGTALGAAGRTVSRVLSDNSAKLEDATNTIGEKLPRPGDVTEAARRGVGIAVENPIGLALGALAVGFLAGLLVPVTDLEREKVGPLRDQFLDRAKDVGADVLEQGRAVLQETAEAALGAAQQAAVGAAQQALGQSPQSRGPQNDAAMQRNTLEPGAPGTASP